MSREGIDIFSAEEMKIQDQELSISSRQSFTLLFIKEGEGYVNVSDHRYEFQEGKLFLMNTDFVYNFYSDNAVALLVRCPLNFIDQIRSEADRIETCDNLNKLNYIAYNYHSQAGCVFRNDADLDFATTLLNNIVREYTEQNNKDYLIIRQSIAILLNLVARNLIMSDTKDLEENSAEYLVMKIISYVQQHIKEPQLTKVSVVAQQFDISKNYFGEFFKKNVGVSYQAYLLDYRLKLVETRLKFSNMRLKEIASELNFNDESHLSKTFKKYKGCSPSEYRNSQS